jgi:hypothetical protein
VRGNGSVEGEADRWGPLSASEREREAVPFRVCTLLGFGAILRLGRIGAPWPFSIFISFSSFPFLISDLFPNLLQKVSIQNKQIPSAFK